MSSCFIEVNLSALRHNFDALSRVAGPTCGLICVVKANAYGLGAIECGRELLDAGAQMLAVTRVDEAVPLREAGLRGDILLLTPALPDELETVLTHNLVACISDFEDAARLSKAAQSLGVAARAHWKLDTGMNRLGTPAQEAAQLWPRLSALPNLNIEACFTHFARAGEPDEKPTRDAFARFQSATESLPINGAHHCANSSALLRFPEMRGNACRPGTVLYGQFPSAPAKVAGTAAGVTLRDPFAARARIIAVRNVKAGASVGYGSEWTAARDSRIATLAVGYADGLTMEPRAREENALTQIGKTLRGIMKPATSRSVTLHNRECPIVGRVAMQSCSIDVTGVDVQIGDVATARMRRVAAGANLPRVYVRD